MKTKNEIARLELLEEIKKQELVNNLAYRHISFNFGLVNTKTNRLIMEIKDIVSIRSLLPGECTRYTGMMEHLHKQVVEMKNKIGDKALIDIDSCLDIIREKIKIRKAKDVDLLVEQFSSVAGQIHTHYSQYHILSCLERLNEKLLLSMDAINEYNKTVYKIDLNEIRK